MSITGRRWRRPGPQCPEWCARDHQCTARHGHPTGEHRSSPLRWRLPYGLLVATRVATVDRRDRLEVRTTVRLAGDEETARVQAYQLAVGIDAAIRRVLGLPPGTELLVQLARKQERREVRR